MNTDVRKLVLEARALLVRMSEGSPAADAAVADDLLLFCYRLRDGYRIARSSVREFRGPTFASLNSLLYELESKPQETMNSPEWRSVIESLLRALATGTVVIETIQGAPKRSHPS